MPSELDLPRLQLAEAAVFSFLDALKARDEAALAVLVYPESLITWEASPGAIRSRFLHAAEITEDELGKLGIVHTARVLPSGTEAQPLVAFGLLPWGQKARMVLEPTPAHAIAVIWDDGRWKVWGMPDPGDFAAATLVPLPTETPVRDEVLSVLGAEWIMALQPHLDVLMALEHPADEEASLVSPIECSHAIAAISMLAFAIESLGARLAVTGRLSGNIPEAIITSLPDNDWQQEVTELFVVRNVVTHNHVWRLGISADAAWEAITVDASEHLFGDRDRRNYRAAVDQGADRTKRLRLHVVPTGLRRSDVARALGTAVRTFDHLAALDIENMRSLSDHPVRLGGRARRIRDVHLDEHSS